MQPCRLHITGASGTGTTSLGRAVAAAWAVPHADVDDYFWEPTDPPYVEKRPEPERLALMEALFVPRDAWVLSGALMGWGDALIPRFDAVVLLSLNPAVRMARLQAREDARYSDTIAPDGPGASAHQAFMDWARGYDDPTFAGRNVARHDRWLSDLPCPVLRLDSTEPVTALVATAREWTSAAVEHELPRGLGERP